MPLADLRTTPMRTKIIGLLTVAVTLLLAASSGADAYTCTTTCYGSGAYRTCNTSCF
jgi:hypothetical protein